MFGCPINPVRWSLRPGGLGDAQSPLKLWIKRCKNMHSGHFLAHKPAFLNLLFSSPWSQTSTITYLNLTCKISSPVTYHEGGSGHYSDSPLLRRPIIPTAHCSDSPFLRKPIIPSKMVKSSIIILKPVVFLLYLTED